MDQYDLAVRAPARVRYARSIAFGIVAALAVGLAWFGLVSLLGRWSGVPAAALGVAVGYAVLFGSGHSRGWRLQTISVATALSGMLVTTALAMRILATKAPEELARFGITHVPLRLPIRTYWNLIVESFAADVTTLVFMALGLWMAIAVPRRYETYG